MVDTHTSAALLPTGLDDPAAVTFLFTDIEGSTRLWEQQPAAMQTALRRHDELALQAVQRHGGRVVKTTGDGLHAAFASPLAAVLAARDFCLLLADPDQALALPLLARCGLHLGFDEQRGGDYYGRDVNRAARVMQCAHGGQILMSRTVAEQVRPQLARLGSGAGLLDLGLVHLRDLAAPEQIHQLLHAGLRAQFPALRSLAATPNNLPCHLNSFVGRERELGEARALLQRHRLLSLVGLGGIGKTRLARQLAADLLDDYPDGVWCVELAPLHDPELLPQAVAAVLGVREEGADSLLAALQDFVAKRRLLLLLDNCEHLLDACAALASRLLQAGAGLKVLATSREALQTAGEVMLVLQPLAVHRLTHVPTVVEAAAQPAVQLFVDRVRLVQPGFRLEAGNVLAVSTICGVLEGIPLALELAAARARQMSVAQLAARISDRLRLLNQGDRAAQPRQQTLRALLDWSHELLTPAERALLRRLSVFAGGWTLDAAEAVCPGGQALPQSEVMDLLGRLVDKSLVSVDLDSHRYRMLETVRQYAQEQLAAETIDFRLAHLRHYLDLAERAAVHLTGTQQGDWLPCLDADRDNLLAAHAPAVLARADTAERVRLVQALRVYWVVSGQFGVGIRLTLEVLERLPRECRDAGRAEVLYAAGQLLYYVGLYARSRALNEDCVAIARELGEVALEGKALDALGAACWGQGDIDAARRHIGAAVAIARRHWQNRDLAVTLTSAAQFHRSQAEFKQARAMYLEALELVKDEGDNFGLALVLVNVVMVEVELHDLDAALRHLGEGIAVAHGASMPMVTQALIDAATGWAAESGRDATAAELHGWAERLSASIGYVRDPADRIYLDERLTKVRMALGPAAFRAAMEVDAGLDLSHPAVLDELSLRLADNTAPASERRLSATGAGPA
jgi:predicted ATPase/class 3 adenylate cyclase